MKLNKIYFSLFFFLFLFILTGKAGYTFSSDDSFLNKSSIQPMNQKSSTNRIATVTYTNHPRIEILNETAFQTYGFSGDGSNTDPYTIEDLNITETGEFSCIIIQDIDANVTIQNNFLDGRSNSDYGISLENVTNVNITHNQIFNANTGIKVNCNESLIQNNTIELSSSIGIYVNGDDNIVEENQISNAAYGIIIQGNGSSITANLIFNCTDSGIRITNPSANNLIKWNDFVWNYISADSQALVQDESGSNTFTDNYWDDSTYPDTNTDGIVDNPYIIPYGMDGNITDDSPRTTPYNSITSSLHYFNRPRIISLSTSNLIPEQVILSKVVSIEWCPVTDSKGHTIKYSLFYSAVQNLVDVWVAIAENITENRVDWNTRDLQDSGGMCCFGLKVVAMCSDGLSAEYTTAHKFGIENLSESSSWGFPIFLVTLCTIAIITRKKRH